MLRLMILTKMLLGIGIHEPRPKSQMQKQMYIINVILKILDPRWMNLDPLLELRLLVFHLIRPSIN